MATMPQWHEDHVLYVCMRVYISSNYPTKNISSSHG